MESSQESKQLKEAKLFPQVRLWLEGMGYTVYAEVPQPYGGGPIDVVGVKDNCVIAVEMKMSLSRKVLHQAILAQCAVDLSYAAVPTLPRESSLDSAKDGVGVIRVTSDGVEVIREASRPKWYPSPSWKAKMLERISCMTPAGEATQAGIPQLAGDGPAQDCWKLVEEYRKAHPCAKWREIYQNVQNHYSSHKSMQQALRKASPEYVEWRREQQRAFRRCRRLQKQAIRDAIAQ